MIITISGKGGTGKSTAAKKVAERLKLKHYSSGDFMRELAKEKDISLLELSKEAEANPKIDKEIDKRQIKLGKKQDNFIIDGRLSAHFIPHSIKIFLDCSDKERAKRIFNQKRDEEQASSIEEMIKELQQREASEIKRYKKYYNFNPYDLDNYDFVIDTTSLSSKEVIEKIMGFLKPELG